VSNILHKKEDDLRWYGCHNIPPPHGWSCAALFH